MIYLKLRQARMTKKVYIKSKDMEAVMNNFLFYAHGGSKNHGCEALVRSTCKVLKLDKQDVALFSMEETEDYKYGLNNICEIQPHNAEFKRFSPTHLWLLLKYLITKNKEIYFEFTYKNIIKNFGNNAIALSIGGDNYCYDSFIERLIFLNRTARKRGTKTVLWGCSVEPNLLENPEIVEDLKRYSLINARESLTYNELIKAGITKNTKLYPDPAFQLDMVELPLPEGFVEGKTIGINVSPLIAEYEKVKGSTMKNYDTLLQYIIDNTDLQIALVPHVVWDNNNDLTPLTKLFEKFKHTGRVILLGDNNCMELKGFISRLRMLIAARTHATVAAYSTCVPTLVVGYSIKAKGIANDIFGTYENYVIPVQTLANEDDLINAFKWLYNNEDSIRKHLQDFMPAYKAKSLDASKEIQNLVQEK